MLLKTVIARRSLKSLPSVETLLHNLCWLAMRRLRRLHWQLTCRPFSWATTPRPLQDST
jgi:hypothetical protein